MKTKQVFEEGEVVTLKSGGPKMTVLGVDELRGEVDVVWFNEDGELRSKTVQDILLMSVKQQVKG